MPGTNLTRDEAASRAALLHVNSYDVVLDLTTGPTTFLTSTTVRFAARAAGVGTWIDFVGDSVTSVTLNGVALDPAEVFADSRIALPALAPDNVLVVDAVGRYTNSGEGLHRFVDPVDNEVYLYSQFEVPDSRRVYAVFEQPDLKATFAFTATVPDHWVVVSNQPAPEPVPGGEGRATWAFEPTPRISSYITALCAGPYTVRWDEVQGRDAVIPMGIFARRSITEHVDYGNLFDCTKAGILFFEKEFDGAFPFAKYDQLFVPEYNAGAMENAGCVTITDAYVFRGQPSEPLVERRALTILHELAHMWFGDLVTMKWWDDLWLNESFAEWASSVCQAEATEWPDAWTTFHSHEKTWAYQQDQQSDTHPVYADMRDLVDVTVNFDGITYAKGGSVLKQLVAYVGRDAFREGLRSYFRKHAWGNTTMGDLFAEFEAGSGRDLSDWAQRWLKTSGPSTLALDITTDDNGVITAAAMTQTVAGSDPTLRPHRVGIGRYDLLGGRLDRVGYVEVDVDGPRTELPELVGLPRPALLLPNDEDLTYAKIALDPLSLQTAMAHIDAFDDSLARSLVLGALWEMLRDGALAPSDFVDVLLRVIPVEEHTVVLRTILRTTKQIPSMLLATLRWFLPEAARPAMVDKSVNVIRTALDAAVPGSDKQQQLVVAYAALARHTDDLTRLQGILDGSVVVPGLSVDQDLRWALLTQIAASGGASEDDIAAELDRDPSLAGREQALKARAAIPTAQAKTAAWALAIEQDTQTNAALEAIGAGFRRCDDPALLRPFVESYLDMLEPVFADRSYAIAERCVKYFYPLDIADAALRDRTRAWLADHEDAPAGLRRLVIEQLAVVETAVAIQEREGS
ncbi:MAG: aminopeptidase N [Actinomycetales bacterium]|uniref:Aminopeptidase N n=1 Tax=Candidatus Phosphoribacter hodrii TaxID=2953743 RepID=A0A934X596_9MICO|nr:aminopeptidase N [Candidatus Phosphoribacter hodrii]MBL0002533.1 aminopeptidase N [Candidatus Phosphoribacter hodrii]